MPVKPTFLLVLGALLFGLSGCSDANQPNTETKVEGPTVSCEYPAGGEPARPVDPPPTSNVPSTGTVKATLHLEAGDVEVTLDRSLAPCAVNSFVSLTQQDYYSNTVCHRLVDQGIFVLQCGDPTGTGTGGPGYVMAEEVTPKTRYPRGTVAMAKTPLPVSTGSQFFLVWADSDQLQPEYTVIGHMDEAGTDVVAGIAAQGVDAGDGMTPLGENGFKGITLE